MKKAYILMTRVPIPGKTNTRLMGLLSGEEAAEIHKAFLKDLFSMAQGLKDIDLFISYTPQESYEILRPLVEDDFKLLPQEGLDLGSRMGGAIEKLLKLGYDQVILTGTDIPTIQPEDIYEGFDILETKDIVIGPTYDGGYYMIGMKAYHGAIFKGDYVWGGKTVFQATTEKIESEGLTYGQAKKNLDIDDSKDLLKLYKALSSLKRIKAENTLEYIESLGRF